MARLQARDRHHRPPGAARVPDRLSVLRNQVFVLDHMYMSLFSTCGWILRLVVAIGLLMSIHPALAVLALFALPTVFTSTWRPGVERTAEERGAPGQPPGPAPLRDRHHGRSGQGGAGHAHRAAPRRRIGARPGSAGTGRWRPRAGTSAAWHALAWMIFGGAYVGAIVFVSSTLQAPAGRRAARARRGLAPLRLHRRDRGRDRLPRAASGSTAPAAWPGSRTTRHRVVATADQPAPDAAARGHPARGRVVRLSRHRTPRPRDDRPHAARGRGRRARRRERRGQDARWSSCCASCTSRRRGASSWTARRSARMRAEVLALSAWPARSRTSSASSCPPGTPSASATSRASTTSRRSRRPSRRAGAEDVVARLPRRARDPARADLAGRRRGLVRPVAEDRARAGVHARAAAAARARRAHGRPGRRRPNMRCSSATRRRRVATEGLTILVSHRFSTVRMADLIVVLDGARVPRSAPTKR
mgnify:CR=1 FL=1